MFNNLSIMGRVTKPLELKHTSEGMAVLEFDIANTSKVKSKEVTTFLRCVAYARTAEVLTQFVSKGDRVLLQGELRQNSYTDKSGNNRSYHFLQVNNFDFIERKEAQAIQEIKPEPKPKQDNEARGRSLKDIMQQEFDEIPF